MKRVLITGANSYIGTSFENWAQKAHPDAFFIHTVDMRDGRWASMDFSSYDCVFHVAGIAHSDTGRITAEKEKLYDQVNYQLALETAKKAKKEGVKQFVLMSSIMVYGKSASAGKQRLITKETELDPENCYAASKLRADRGIQALADERFASLSVRSPMVYGKGCKGNFPALQAIVKRLPFFPDTDSQRSMIYIDDLCEFLCQMMLRGESGVVFPQNAEYARIGDLARFIAAAQGKKIIVSRAFNWIPAVLCHFPGKIGKMTNKAFGGLCYAMEMSRYPFDYQVADLKTSVAESI